MSCETLTILTPKIFSFESVCDDLYRYGYACVKNFLNDDILQGLLHTIKTAQENHDLQKAKIGRGGLHHLSSDIRRDKTYWIDCNTPYERQFMGYLYDIRIELNKKLTLGLFDIEAHYALYEQGGFYHRHLDSFKGDKNRIISLVVYLNKNWQIADGGLLQLYRDSQADYPFASVIPEYNHAVFFLSEDIPHAVTLSHKNRFSIACWFRCRTL